MAPPPNVVSSDDLPRAVSLTKDQELVFRLSANPGTGYRWDLATAPVSIVAAEGVPRYSQDPGGQGRPGAGGTEIWRYRAIRSGTERLVFEYRRPWERGIPPARVLRFTVTVD